MDDTGRWNQYLLQQRSLIPKNENELMLELTVPLVADQDLFRVGWSLKRPGSRSYVAITTGVACWSRRDMRRASEHILLLMDECNYLLEPMRFDRQD